MKCKICGKEIKKGIMCDDCLEERRMKLPEEPFVSIEDVQADLIAKQMEQSPYSDLPDTQGKICEITDAMKDLLLYKNQKYGDSAINSLCIFTKHLKEVETNTASILVRLDDKLSRVKNADELRTNDISDIIGYCTLLLISLGVTKEDIKKFKD